MAPPHRPGREGSLEAPTRHPIDWKNPDYYNKEKVFTELERVFDHCHGCRRCVSLCNSFPTLFDLVDESETFEVDGVARQDYWKVVDECYLCDLCFMTKCPYIPPHEWNIDFPHLMLQAKALKFKQSGAKLRDKVLTSTDALGKTLANAAIAPIANAVNKVTVFRKVLDSAAGIHNDAWIPEYASKTMRKQLANNQKNSAEGIPAGKTTGKVALFATCYGNFNEPVIGKDLVAVFEHNDIPVILATKEICCGMPKLELGDLESVEKAKNANIAMLAKLVDEGYDIITPVPSCNLMFRQEIPLMFPDDADVKKVQAAIFDPFEYLSLRHKAEKLKTDFKNPLNKVAYHAACHQRVQKFGQKTREILALVPDTDVKIIERCSGHDGTYALKSEHHEAAIKIARPVIRAIKQHEADHHGSDCPMAGHHIEKALADGSKTKHPLALLRQAYGI